VNHAPQSHDPLTTAVPANTCCKTDGTGLDILSAELVNQRNLYLRLVADFDNFKKRTRKEGEARTAAQMASLFHELLPVIDNLERALASGASPGSQQIHQGVAMTLQQLRLLLNKHGIVTEECIGQMFDPHRHEAISQRYDPSQGDHIILEVLQRGYWQGERILRPARVVVNDLTSALSAQSAVKNSLD